jgi:hypothetical protein
LIHLTTFFTNLKKKLLKNQYSCLKSRHSSNNGRSAKAMGDHGEMGEMSLYGRVQQCDWLGVAEGGPVLVQQVHQLLRNKSEKE